MKGSLQSEVCGSRAAPEIVEGFVCKAIRIAFEDLLPRIFETPQARLGFSSFGRKV